MSKRWFDLLATIIAVPYVILFGSNLFGVGDYSNYDPRAWGLLVAYMIFVIAIRRFFYNKEK